MPDPKNILDALHKFADAVQNRFAQHIMGEPEEAIRDPFSQFMEDAGVAMGLAPEKKNIVCSGEVHTDEGRPDYAVNLNGLLAGFVELKAPGKGVRPSSFKGHDKRQFEKFKAIPNLLYTDGIEWALYYNGELVKPFVNLKGDITTDGAKAVNKEEAEKLYGILQKFLRWDPENLIPRNRNGFIDLQKFAEQLAPMCRMLRDDVTLAMAKDDSPLNELAKEWRQLLFPDASDAKFADSYAQTVTFALLLGRSDGADPLTLASAEKELSSEHGLLSRALKILTDESSYGSQKDSAYKQLEPTLDLLVRFIGALPTGLYGNVTELDAKSGKTGSNDPWLYFYEHFLSVYDPKLRKDAGAYYTPIEVVHCQVRLIDDLLRNKLGKPDGFASKDVITLDPALGTGTYLLGVIEHAMAQILKRKGEGAMDGEATALAQNLYGFELMVGPYSVSELRISQMLKKHEATMPEDGPHILLTDTLESPHAELPQTPLYQRVIAEHHEKALEVKSGIPVIVCLGNPPYDRHDAVSVADGDRLSKYGGWVRFSDPIEEGAERAKGKSSGKTSTFNKAILKKREEKSILQDFIRPAREAGHGVHIKNLYNLYVYFWRWALWKVFENDTSKGPGIVSFISASSYIDGDAFSGMREHMRRVCDEIWIIDIGGEGRGTRKTDNVFAIQTPVAIAIALRHGETKPDKPAIVRYASIKGTRAEKLESLESLNKMKNVNWQEVPDDWQQPFRPAGSGSYFSSPELTDLMPWQHSGSQLKRTWPIGESEQLLVARWTRLMESQEKAKLLKETRDRRITSSVQAILSTSLLPSISNLTADSLPEGIRRYAYRSFDRQWVIADNRVSDYPRLDLWDCTSDYQIFVTTLLNHPLSDGPALSSCCSVPDLHHFRGSYGAKEAIPLYRTSDNTQPNILPGLMELLSKQFGKAVTPEDFLAYVYGLLAQNEFTKRFEKELETRELRVPLTKDKELFEQARSSGAHLLWLHTYGDRYLPAGAVQGQVPDGSARCDAGVGGKPEDYPEEFSHEGTVLKVGKGRFSPVSREVYEFEVSGLKVVQSWLGYRMKHGKGKKSSPLDDIRPEVWTKQFTDELLELLWVLEATLASYPKQAEILDAVLAGPLFHKDELPEVSEEMRKPPKREKKKANKDLFEDEDE